MMDMTTRTPLLLLAAVTAALALGACGGAGSGGGTGTNGANSGEDKAYEGALKFAKCMRDHGLDFPDPQRQPDGGILQKAGGKGKPGRRPEDDPKMKPALKDCQHFQDTGGGEAPSPAEEAKMQDAFFAYAKCMRGKGINMPDPKVSGGRVEMSIGRGGKVDPESPAFKVAEKACHKLLAEVEKGGPGGPGGAGEKSKEVQP
jgi:hypothetical protein